MLMSLTTRLRPIPPEDSRGVTSVVAISYTFLIPAEIVQRAEHMVNTVQKETFHYTAASLECRGEIACPQHEGTCLGTGKCRVTLRSLFGLEEVRHVAKLIIS